MRVSIIVNYGLPLCHTADKKVFKLLVSQGFIGKSCASLKESKLRPEPQAVSCHFYHITVPLAPQSSATIRISQKIKAWGKYNGSGYYPVKATGAYQWL